MKSNAPLGDWFKRNYTSASPASGDVLPRGEEEVVPFTWKSWPGSDELSAALERACIGFAYAIAGWYLQSFFFYSTFIPETLAVFRGVTQLLHISAVCSVMRIATVHRKTRTDSYSGCGRQTSRCSKARGKSGPLVFHPGPLSSEQQIQQPLNTHWDGGLRTLVL